MANMNYQPKVDHHIYAIPLDHGCRTVDDWIDLAIAAMDQAGFSIHSQNNIRDELCSLASQEKLDK